MEIKKETIEGDVYKMVKDKDKPKTLKIDVKKFFKNILIPKLKFDDTSININKGLASLGVCLLGVISMWITKGETGIGWAIIGLIIIW